MGWYEALKDAAKLARQTDNIPLYQNLLDASEELMEKQKTIADLEEANRVLMEKLKTKERAIFKNGAYWIENKDGQDGPFCTRCYEKDNLLIRLNTTMIGAPECPDCKNHYDVDF